MIPHVGVGEVVADAVGFDDSSLLKDGYLWGITFFHSEFGPCHPLHFHLGGMCLLSHQKTGERLPWKNRG
jgi:hypothetical protein